MNVEVELPDLGDEAGDEAIISEWRYEEGDFVEESDPLVEVVAGKETIDVPCPASGIIVEILMHEDDLARVGDVMAIMEVRDEEGFLPEEEE